MQNDRFRNRKQASISVAGVTCLAVRLSDPFVNVLLHELDHITSRLFPLACEVCIAEGDGVAALSHVGRLVGGVDDTGRLRGGWGDGRYIWVAPPARRRS